MRILLLEDEPLAETLMRRILGPFVSRIDTTGKMAQGMEWAKANEYDVVVMDLRLLDSDRDESIAMIPRLKHAARAPVVVITGWPDPNLGDRVLAAGADSFVHKRDANMALLCALQAVVEHSEPGRIRTPTFAEHVAMLERLVEST